LSSGTIDVHVHLSGRKDDALLPYARRNGLSYTLGELLRSMKRNGIARALLLSPPLKSGAPLPNEEVIATCQTSGGLLSPVLTVAPTAREVNEAVSMARKARGTVKGFKVLLGYAEVFAYDPVFDGLYDYAEKEGLPVMFHTGDTADSRGSLVHSHPLTLDALANARPGLKIVACHFGNPWIDDVGELLYKHKNMYADVSGLAVGGGRYSVRYTESLVRKLSDAIYFAGGADRVVFGSDYPVTLQSTALALVAKLGIDEADKGKILSRNARRVFSL
jgi:hypothetical protein